MTRKRGTVDVREEDCPLSFCFPHLVSFFSNLKAAIRNFYSTVWAPPPLVLKSCSAWHAHLFSKASKIKRQHIIHSSFFSPATICGMFTFYGRVLCKFPSDNWLNKPTIQWAVTCLCKYERGWILFRFVFVTQSLNSWWQRFQSHDTVSGWLNRLRLIRFWWMSSRILRILSSDKLFWACWGHLPFPLRLDWKSNRFLLTQGVNLDLMGCEGSWRTTRPV